MFAAFLWLQGQGFRKAYDSGTWPAADGKIIQSNIERKFDINGPRSKPIVRYSYSVGGNNFENDIIAFGLFRGMMTWGYADKKVSQFPKGQAAKVFYDPIQPEVSCLETGGIGWEDVFMAIVSISGIVLAFGCVYSFACKLLPFNEVERLATEDESGAVH